MKHDEKTFNKEVDYYINKLKKQAKGKTIFIVIGLENKSESMQTQVCQLPRRLPVDVLIVDR